MRTLSVWRTFSIFVGFGMVAADGNKLDLGPLANLASIPLPTNGKSSVPQRADQSASHDDASSHNVTKFATVHSKGLPILRKLLESTFTTIAAVQKEMATAEQMDPPTEAESTKAGEHHILALTFNFLSEYLAFFVNQCLSDHALDVVLSKSGFDAQKTVTSFQHWALSVETAETTVLKNTEPDIATAVIQLQTAVENTLTLLYVAHGVEVPDSLISVVEKMFVAGRERGER